MLGGMSIVKINALTVPAEAATNAELLEFEVVLDSRAEDAGNSEDAGNTAD